MRYALYAGAGAIAIAGALALVMAPNRAAPPLVYETVSGYPMRVYYRNVGESQVEVNAAGGIPALSTDGPLPQERIDSYFDQVKKEIKPTFSAVRPGDFVRFMVEDPEELAWIPGKTEGMTYFYVFAAMELTRSGSRGKSWISELCLVAKTGEAFQRCSTHNEVYAGG